jgi:hypothetical protein
VTARSREVTKLMPKGHADDCEMMVRLLTGWTCTCGYDPEERPLGPEGQDHERHGDDE